MFVKLVLCVLVIVLGLSSCSLGAVGDVPVDRVFRVANIIMPSMMEDPDPNFFTNLNSSSLKPAGWQFTNPHHNYGSNPWLTNIGTLTVQELLDYDFVFISNHQGTNFSNADRDKLQEWVQAGGTVYIDDCAGMRVYNFFEPFQFNDGCGGTKIASDSNHPFFNSIYHLSASEINAFGGNSSVSVRN